MVEWAETPAEKRKRFAKFIGMGLASGAIAGILTIGAGIVFVREAASRQVLLPRSLVNFNVRYNRLLDLMNEDNIFVSRRGVYENNDVPIDPQKISVMIDRAEAVYERIEKLSPSEVNRVLTPRTIEGINQLTRDYTGLKPVIQKHQQVIRDEQQKATQRWLKKWKPVGGTAFLVGGAIGLGIGIRRRKNGSRFDGERSRELQDKRIRAPYTRRPRAR